MGHGGDRLGDGGWGMGDRSAGDEGWVLIRFPEAKLAYQQRLRTALLSMSQSHQGLISSMAFYGSEALSMVSK